MSDPRSVIQLEGVRKTYGSLVAVNNIDLTIQEGEFFSLLGPSGCGKTTTLRMISGLESPTEGTISLFEEDVTEVPPQERGTNLVFQNLALFPHMTVEGNIRFGLRHEDISEEETQNRITEMLRVVDMEGVEDRNVTQLSGGQQQRIALARSLAKQPDVLLLDEPLASLDRKLRQRMQFELRSIQEDLQTTFFYVTHDQEVAMTMSDRMAVMRDGDLVQVGTPEEIYEDPANNFVADFIGDANFVQGRVVTGGGEGIPMFEDETGLIKVKAPDLQPGKAQLVLRPENITIGMAAADRAHSYEAEVTERVHQGQTINFETVLENGTELEINQKNQEIKDGETVMVGFDVEDYAVVAD